jgi:hypothetical protein
MLTLSLLACSEDKPEPTTPEGAFKLFYEALASHDEDGVWEYLDQTTKDVFIDAYRTLLRIDKVIDTYFDPSERKYIKKRTGSYLLKEQSIDSGQALYRFLFDLDALSFDLDHEVGADIQEMSFTDETESIAQLQTRGGQSFIFLREDDLVWRTASLRNLFEAGLAPIMQSEAALREFARENLNDELERRKRIIGFAIGRAQKAQKAAAPTPAAATPAADPVPAADAGSSADAAAAPAAP